MKISHRFVENQVIFMWNVLHKYSFWKSSKRQSEKEVNSACMCMCQATHQVSAYPCFCSMKRLEVFLLPLDEMLVHHDHRVYILFASTYLYTCMDTGALWE